MVDSTRTVSMRIREGHYHERSERRLFWGHCRRLESSDIIDTIMKFRKPVLQLFKTNLPCWVKPLDLTIQFNIFEKSEETKFYTLHLEACILLFDGALGKYHDAHKFLSLKYNAIKIYFLNYEHDQRLSSK